MSSISLNKQALIFRLLIRVFVLALVFFLIIVLSHISFCIRLISPIVGLYMFSSFHTAFGIFLMPFALWSLPVTKLGSISIVRFAWLPAILRILIVDSPCSFLMSDSRPGRFFRSSGDLFLRARRPSPPLRCSSCIASCRLTRCSSWLVSAGLRPGLCFWVNAP